METTEGLTDQIIRAYEDVQLEVGDDPTEHPDPWDRVEPFLPVMVESLHQDGVDITLGHARAPQLTPPLDG